MTGYTHPDKPPVPQGPNSLPSKRRACPDCGDERPYHDRRSEREELGGYTDRFDYWCPECDAYVGGEVDYHGPTPVHTHNGWETH